MPVWLWERSALPCSALQPFCGCREHDERRPAGQLGGLVVRPWRRLFSVVTSTSVVLKCFCNARALVLLEGYLHSSQT